MANGYLVGQTIVTAADEKKSTNIFDKKQVIKVGITGCPGSKFLLNSTDDRNKITLNKYGVYELDVSDVGFLTSCYVTDLGTYTKEDNDPVTPPIYIDYVYYKTSLSGGADA